MTMSYGRGKRRKLRLKPAGDLNAPLPEPKTADTYRERSLKIHGWICAKCGREFDSHNLHLLTVHHRDGNPRNNPPDGSNWENLCMYCHDDEHSRGILGEYLGGKNKSR